MSDEIKRLLERAPFSFVGTVLHLGAATMTDIPMYEHTGVVQVDHVLHAPDEFTRLAGHRITVQFSPDNELPAVGQTFAFFAEGLAFGESIAVAEIGRLPVESVEPNMSFAVASGAPASAFTALLNELQNDKLREHMQQADAVVIGRVVKIEKAGSSTPSEHDPDWWRATIDVYHVESGSVQSGNLDVLFANSLDIRWYRAPKPRAAQGGVWILHNTPSDLQALARFHIIHPEDYQATQQMDVLRKPGN